MMNLTKKLIISVISIILSIIIIGVGILKIQPYFKKIYSAKVWRNVEVSDEEKMLYNFINTKLTDDDGGIHTNYINEDTDGDITKGHYVLSESQGIMLLYYLERDDKENFDFVLNYIKNNMLLEHNLLSWRVNKEEKSQTSATIDDLRVTKALLLANEKWGEFEYRKLAIKMAGGIHKELLDEDTLTNFNDGYNMSDGLDLCYLDLPTLRMLANIDYFNWKSVYDKSVEIINNGYISDTLPLYRKTFYRKDNIYDSENADTLLSMIVILNKLEENQDVSKSIEWIKKELKEKGAVYTSYSAETSEALSDIESTSIYSFIIQISTIINDKEMQDIAMTKLKAYQVKNPESPIYGGYGSEDGTGVYSYDNLNALISYRNIIEYK